ncbi:MAG: RluA family pseudouridine synthase, partial [Clostridiales Family XIII bacterium]|nr:RluA family pseudouridine synthase [Clostridiales Family XIII bacterium]
MSDERRYELRLDASASGNRLDAALSERLRDMSRSCLQKLIGQGNVRINGDIADEKKRRVKEGDRVEITVPAAGKTEILPQDIPLRVIFEDEDMLVVDKPKGLVVHPAPGNPDGTLVNAVLHHCGGRLPVIGGETRPGVVHRIDKDTSGLLMIAKNDRAHRSLSAQLAAHKIAREYHALAYNNLREDSGTIRFPLGRDPLNRRKQAVVEKNGREAVTHYRLLERLGGFVYLALRLETGRTHQIRVHMAHIGHPLLGDPLYGPRKKRMGIDG